MLAITAILAFVGSAAAFAINFPNSAEGWNTVGYNEIVWSFNGTDRANFTAVLTNPDASLLSNNGATYQILLALVDKTANTVNVISPDSAGWKEGEEYRIDFVQDSEHIDNVLASSQTFDIRKAPVSSTTSKSQSATSTGDDQGTATTTGSASETSGFSGFNNMDGASALSVAHTGILAGSAALIALLF
ncbi:hypothetical protein CYLTODRAFT_400137 [Cylindrobasidium torrendii FP15055 ss-10]|uniref:Uncharacterized protein n=1 Tax=Cylindrobasidium torrendii FP15055 ss-10 TaxID=1314674 RepID=A0A0D7B7Z5_9AGAR|nr:hypothetical protein CYLTODRAFT_400137 [Cylindrobasidium torrendii FP15055 ss-10]